MNFSNHKTIKILILFSLFSIFSFSQNSVDREIKGKVAGVNIYSQSNFPGTPSRIRIRGQGSFFGNNSPLIILDGVPIHNDPIGANSRFPGLDMLSTINPSDIESIRVLKNAKDVAPYGIRGTNGVIVIVTKNGMSKNNPLKIFK